MEDQKGKMAVQLLLLVPIFMAFVGLTFRFNKIDLGYLVLASIVFIRYVIKKKKVNQKS